MRYPNIHRGIFLARPNRFIAHVELEGETVICHVKNTGRCQELLVTGATVYLVEADNPARKTRYDLVAVEKTPSVYDVSRETNVRLINMDSQAPNKVFGEWAAAGHFMPGLTLLRPETVFGKSRFDFYWEAQECGGMGHAALPRSVFRVGRGDLTPPPSLAFRRGFVEVKGVTLETDGGAYFPDAPTERGVKHVEELMAARAAGYEAALCFVIQMKGVDFFSPNDATHPAFGAALRRAAGAGVHLMAYDCDVTAESLVMGQAVEIRL